MHYDVSLFILENRCYEKHNYCSYALCLEDILNMYLRQQNLLPSCLLGKGVIKSFKSWNS